MAPNTEVAEQQTVSDFFCQIQEEMKKSMESLNINYPSENEITENETNVKVSLNLGDFKSENVKVKFSSEGQILTIKGTLSTDEENEHSFFRTLQLPYSCLEDNIDIKDEDGVLNITVYKDEEKTQIVQKQREEEEKKVQEALEKINAMASLKPITLEEVSEDESNYKLKICLGDYAQDEINPYFNGPHYLVLEAVKEAEIKRKYYRTIYFDSPCNTQADVEVQRSEDGFLNIVVPKDLEAIKAFEEFKQQMKPIEDFFQSSEEEDFTDNDNEFQMKILVKDFTNEEVKVSIDEDNNLSIEAKHEEDGGPCFSLYKKFPLPEGLTKDNVKHEINQDGQLVIKGKKNKPALCQG